MARHARLLGEDRDLGEVLDRDAEQHVVGDLAEAGELALADVGDAPGGKRQNQRLDLAEGSLGARRDRAELAGAHAFGVARDG